ncbi:hypothetical protein KKG83_04485 [Candidatus Micrarchaeota archaeon]|nr:hypothetical protein [Candidatus Micrarchaeota archaeon]
MKKIQVNEIISKAKELNSHGKNWHFHMLGKNCKFNESKEKFCLVLEEGKKVFCAVFEEKPLKEAKILADLLYGKNFLEKKQEGKTNPEFQAIIKRAYELEKQKTEWHHHHLPPECVFNEQKGKHCIVLEDEKETLIAVYSKKPMNDLVKIEKLFYKDL